MKPPLMITGLLLICAQFSSGNSQVANSSCNTNLTSNAQIVFDTSSLTCSAVWKTHGFILRYAQAAPSIWSFVLSAPNPGSYVAIGFSPSGQMVGSSAIVGWVGAGGSATMTQYFLSGQTPNQVKWAAGDLSVVGNTSSIVLDSSVIYMSFQLYTDRPLNQLIYAVGPSGFVPAAPQFLLTEHDDRISTTVNYASGDVTQETKAPYSNLKKSHGILNILGWGILLPIGVMIARYMKHLDPTWFYAHLTIQSLGFIFGLSGVICGFVLNNRLGANVSKHKGLGISILVLGCLQVMAFLARLDKASKVRRYWNWYHHFVGRIVLILAAANIFYGIHLGKAGSSWNAGYGVAVAVLTVVPLIFEVRMWLKK